MTPSDKIHIVFACDDNYAQHAGVAIASLKEQQISGLPVHVHLLDGGISPVNLQRLFQLKDERLDITVYKGNIEEYSRYLVLQHFSTAMYLRLSVEKMLPQEISRILYCDCDVIFLKPIDALWNLDLQGHFLAAVEEGWNNAPNNWRPDLGIDEPGRYFNSGVLLIDLNLWRSHQICEKVKDFIRSNWNTLRYPDQDGLNAVLSKKYLAIEKSWNFFSCTIGRKKTLTPHIVHFASEFKPWFYKSVDPFQEDYIKFLLRSSWKDYQFPDKNAFNTIKRKFLLFAPAFLVEGITFFTFALRRFMHYCARQIALFWIERKH